MDDAAADGGPPPVRVTFVSSHALRGGAELHLLALLERLGAPWIRGVVSLAHGPLVDALAHRGYPHDVVPTSARLGMVSSAWRLRRLLRRQRPELIHADGVKAALVVALATLGLRVPVVWFKVDFARDGRLAHAVARRCRLVIGISHAVTETFGGPLRERVRVVPCGIPDYSVDRAAGRQLALDVAGAAADAELVLHLGRLHPRKGAHELVDVIPDVLARRPAARFLFLPASADGPVEEAYERQLRTRIRELGIEDSVAIVTGNKEPVRVLSGCDVLVIPSIPDEVSGWREGFGLVGAEAMAVGTPIAAYADGAIPEVLGDCAELTATHDRAALGDAIVRILSDPALRTRLVSCGSARVERYRLRSTVEEMKRRYREAVDTPA